MGLPQIPKSKQRKSLPPDDPINKALHQLEEYDEGTPKRTTKDYADCECEGNYVEQKEDDV